MAWRTKFLHPFPLVGRGRPVVLADHEVSRGGCADERRHVRGNSAALEKSQVFAQRGPLDRVLDVALLLEHLLFHAAVERSHGIAFAHHFQRDSLANVALRSPVFDQRLVGLAHHVDEAGRDRQAGRADFGLPAVFRQFAHRRDPVAAKGHVAHEGRLAAAVIDRSAANDDVVFRGRSTSRPTRWQRPRRPLGALDAETRISWLAPTNGDYLSLPFAQSLAARPPSGFLRRNDFSIA